MSVRLPLGISDFKKVREGDYTFVDKSLLIAEVLDYPTEVILLTRPRRFGKTLNLSMLRYFFDMSTPANRQLFDGLAIAASKHIKQQGSCPVVFITFKDLKANNFEHFSQGLQRLLAETYQSYGYLEEGLAPLDRNAYSEIVSGKANHTRMVEAIFNLTKWLHERHGQNVVLLIDEYDTPIHTAWSAGYFPEAINMIRGLFGKALKDNENLKKAVLTGILRISNGSIFSDLNNVSVFTLLNNSFSDRFGFTGEEVRELLTQAGRENQMEVVAGWYNGYRVGATTIYNPWSMAQYIQRNEGFIPYWVNTSSNLLIRELLLKAGPEIHEGIQVLITGGTFRTRVLEHAVFSDFMDNTKAFWSFLLFSGYLTVAEAHWDDDHFVYDLKIPNREVGFLYKEIFVNWLDSRVGDSRLQALLKTLIAGEFQQFENLLNMLVRGVLSYYDTAGRQPERVFHAFVLGLLLNLGNRYEISSNKEAGLGRYDILMRPRNQVDPGIIIEFKSSSGEDREKGLQQALDQIRQRDYATALREAGVSRWWAVAVSYHGKAVLVRGMQGF